MRTRILSIFTLLALLLTGCVEPLSEEDKATGTLTLEIASGGFDVATKAYTPTLQNGDRFTNLLVLVINKAGVVVNSRSLTFTEAQEKQVLSFEHLPIGNYYVYAYANIDHTSWQAEGTVIDAAHFDPAQQLKKLTGNHDTPPAPTTTGMLLTGHNAVSVGVQQNKGRVELQRPVARFNVWVYNHTGYPITLDTLYFSDFNADQGYLLGRLKADGQPDIPEGTTYRPLPPYDGRHPSTVPAASGAEPGEMRVYQQLLYENQGADAYRMYASVSMNGMTKKLVTNGVELMPFTRIHDMQPGDTVNVLLVCPNTNDGAFYGWDTRDVPAAHKIIGYPAALSYEAFYQQYAEDVLANPLSLYFRMTLKKTETGYRFFQEDTEINVFDRALELPEVSIREANVETLDSSYPISSEFAGHLVHFTVTGSDNKEYIVFAKTSRRTNYQLAKEKSSNNLLKKGDHMFALYEVNPEGSQLKLIDNETHQVTPLTYMVRNWDLNVVLNVYYGVDDIDINFRVDNYYWSGDGQSTSGYTFR